MPGCHYGYVNYCVIDRCHNEPFLTPSESARCNGKHAFLFLPVFPNIYIYIHIGIIFSYCGDFIDPKESIRIGTLRKNDGKPISRGCEFTFRAGKTRRQMKNGNESELGILVSSDSFWRRRAFGQFNNSVLFPCTCLRNEFSGIWSSPSRVRDTFRHVRREWSRDFERCPPSTIRTSLRFCETQKGARLTSELRK